MSTNKSDFIIKGKKRITSVRINIAIPCDYKNAKKRGEISEI